MDINSLIQTITIVALPVIFAITLHEAAHGYVARYFGDPTAWQAGRISLNPLRHIDPVGTLLVSGLIKEKRQKKKKKTAKRKTI